MKAILVTLLLAANLCFATHVGYDVRKTGTVTAQQLDAEFAKRGGVLKNKGHVFIQMEKKYGVSAQFMAAIAIQESGGGTSRRARRDNDCFGMTGSKAKYTSIDQNIEIAFDNIKNGRYYFNRGKHTVGSIGRTWSRSKDWSKKVASHMVTISKHRRHRR